MAQAETMSTQRLPWLSGERAPTQVSSFGAVDRGAGWVKWVRRELRELSGMTVVADFVRRARPLTDPAPATDHIEGVPSHEDKLGAELQSYSALEHGWDGYDGVPASLDAVTDAFAFLVKRPADITLPYPEISPDGEVGLYWRTDDVFAEVGFYGDGEYSFYARHTPREGGQIEYGRDGCSVVEDWHGGLLLVLNKIDR